MSKDQQDRRTTNVPRLWTLAMEGVLNPLRPVVKYATSTLQSSNASGVDSNEESVEKTHSEESGDYLVMEKDVNGPNGNDEEKQKRLWIKSLEWIHMTEEETALAMPFE